jgi:hypothetical protein
MRSIKSRMALIFTALILAMLAGFGGLSIWKIKGDITQSTHENLMTWHSRKRIMFRQE